jgi:DNA-binding transcriptional MerR regulator
MKNGEFSRKYNVAPSKIRYYIQYGILVPEVKNGQYRFNRNCIRDMDYAVELQQMHFSLKDILEVITLYRKFSAFQPQDMQHLIEIFSKQRQSLQKEMDETYEQEKLLNLHCQCPTKA